MIQHFRATHWDSDSICGTNLVGQRNPIDMVERHTTCIACKAVLEGRPLYQVTAVDEDGHTDKSVFNTPAEQMAWMEEALDNGAVNVTMQIISHNEIMAGEWG
jgi:hypothetical protein